MSDIVNHTAYFIRNVTRSKYMMRREKCFMVSISTCRFITLSTPHKKVNGFWVYVQVCDQKVIITSFITVYYLLLRLLLYFLRFLWFLWLLVTGGWRKLHNEELHNLYSSPSIIKMTKSRRMRWTGHVARMGRGGMLVGYWWESRKEGDHWEDQNVGGWTILR
jgi:hypothetical protein